MTSHAEPGPDPTDAELARAAASLQAELDKKTARFRRPGRGALPPARADDPGLLALAGALAPHAVFVGDFAPDAAPGVTLRAGVLRDGATLALVVAPPGRPPYVELTTFLARPPRLAREVVTTNGRGDPVPARAGVALEQRPELTPDALRARHLERLAGLGPGDDAPVRRWIEPSEAGVLRAIADYLEALGR